MKTLSLKISLSILVGILAVICMTAGVVLAGFSSANLTPSVPVSKISSQVWKVESMENEVTQSSQLTGGALYISATKNKTAIDIPCVMRVSTTFTSVTTTDSWIKQSNGWYYYVGIVGGGYEGDYSTQSSNAVQFCTGYTAGSSPHITVELMQYSTSTTGGFIKEWSPSAGSSQAVLNETTTIDGRSLTPKSGTKFNGSFALFKTETTSSPWRALPASDGTTSSLSGMKVNSDGSLSFENTTYVSTTGWTELKIYNNAPFPMVYSFTITTTTQGTTIAIIDNNDDNWKQIATTDTGNKSFQYVYAKSVLPGQYLSIAKVFKLSVTSGTADISIKVDAVDVDTVMNNKASYGKLIGANLFNETAPFTDWVTAMKAKFSDFPDSGYAK